METVDLITVIQSMEWSDPAYSWLELISLCFRL